MTGMDLREFTEQAAPLYHQVGAAVLAVCGDRHVAEDSAQEALFRYWLQVEGGAEIRDPRAWMVRSALNWCRSQYRHSSAEGRALRRAGTSFARHSALSLDDDVRDAVEALPDRQREVVVLHYLLDMDVASIADATELSTGAVKNALFNARASLRRALEPGPCADTEMGGSRG